MGLPPFEDLIGIRGPRRTGLEMGRQWGEMCLQTAFLLPGFDFKEETLEQSLPSCTLARAFIYSEGIMSSEGSLESPSKLKEFLYIQLSPILTIVKFRDRRCNS